MAIINTFQKCLDSPYLFLDEQAPARVPGLLTLAVDRLDAARAILGSAKSDPVDVGSLAYESMFASLRALVYARGYREAGLKCLLLACDSLYVRTGLIEAAQLQAFEAVQSLKMPYAGAVEAAERFLQTTRQLLEV